MTSTHHFHPFFEEISPSKQQYANKNKHKRSQSFNKTVNISHKNEENKSSLPAIVEFKPFKKHPLHHCNHIRSRSFQIGANHLNKNRLKTRKFISTHKTPKIITDTKRKRKRKNNSNNNNKTTINMNGSLSITQQWNSPINQTMNIQGSKYKHRSIAKQRSQISQIKHTENENDSDQQQQIDPLQLGMESKILIITQQCLEGVDTLAYLVKTYQSNIVKKILNHPKITINKAWFLNKFLNSQDLDGNTALHICSMVGDIDFIQYLIQNCALLNVLNANQQTALDFAVQCENCKVAELLLKNKALPGYAYYENPIKYEQKMSDIKLRSLFKIYLNESKLCSSNHNNHSFPPIHLYEKPMLFTSMSYSTEDEAITDIVSNISSTPPTSGHRKVFASTVNLTRTMDDFFNSSVDFKYKI